ncbi:Uncharacterized protein Rs2_16006 [Raphanus sativus]|nr:Uncharacterized protein Rs2_16006 [Raphanus sativus]
MTYYYNKLSQISEASYNPDVKAWRFRVKVHRVYPLYSSVTNRVMPFYSYVLADEDGCKMEMTVYGDYESFRGLENKEGEWVEIFRTNCFATHTSPLIDPLNNRLFMDFKNIHAIPHMSHRERNYPIDTIGVVFNTEARFDDPARPTMIFYIRNNIDSQIKCVATGKQAYAFRDGLENVEGGQVIVALKMWKVCNCWSKCSFCG